MEKDIDYMKVSEECNDKSYNNCYKNHEIVILSIILLFISFVYLIFYFIMSFHVALTP